MGSVLVRQYRESGYILLFDRENGIMLRVPTEDKEPYWNVRGPELLDISITNYCEKGCSFCYRSSNTEGKHISLPEYEKVIMQAEAVGVTQVALGGGNPNQHPQFVEILRMTRAHNIIPSFTTNGQYMMDYIYDAAKEYCGAVAISWYEPYGVAINAVEQCYARGIKVNIHYLLNQESLKAASYLLRYENQLLSKVSAVVFLSYKPNNNANTLCLRDNCEMDEFLSVVREYRGCKLGFDSCMISFLAKIGDDISPESLDFCEAGRFSAFISETCMLYPCSFMNDNGDDGIDLSQISLVHGWQHGSSFIKIRERLSLPSRQRQPIAACGLCNQYNMCRGGCPEFPINRCREG